jgi:para-nitrobenzyl esterase
LKFWRADIVGQATNNGGKMARDFNKSPFFITLVLDKKPKMKFKLLLVALTLMACLPAQPAQAQCGSGPRYIDTVFAGYTVTTVTYSTVYNLQMDIYQPMGDTQALRPLVVLAHGGSFVTTGGGREDDSTILWLCRDLATKGYVTASIDYRLTTDANLVYPLNGDSAISEVLEAIGDGKASVRYFYKDVLTNGNSYKIDTNNIFIGGNSAGAVLAMQYAYVDSESELSAVFDTILHRVDGTLEGNSGNAGYSDNIKGVISLAGGLNQVSWLSYCSKPIVMAQGTADDIVPYTCGNPEDGAVNVTLCGLGSCAPNIVANTPYYDTMTFAGAGHVPWQSGGIDFYMVDTLITGFLNYALCQSPPPACHFATGIKNVNNAADISVYPNPASDALNISSSELINTITITDETGRTVAEVSDINTLSYRLNTSRLSTGIYFVQISDAQGYAVAVRKVVIE